MQAAMTARQRRALAGLTSVSTGCDAAASIRNICCSMVPALNATLDAPRPARHKHILARTHGLQNCKARRYSLNPESAPL